MKNLNKLSALLLLFFSTGSLLSGEEIKFRANSMSGKNGSKNDATTLSGNAYVKTETMEISADVIVLSGDNFRYITADGSVEGKNTESKLDFSCGKMLYDRTTKIARLEDSVHMIDTANDVTAEAQIIEYNQNTDIATMQINVSIKQKDNKCTSAYALYRKDRQMLEMSGNPKIVQGEDSFRAQEIVLNLDTQEITLDGRVSGTVSDTKKETKKEQKTEKDEITENSAADKESEATSTGAPENTVETAETEAKQAEAAETKEAE